MGREEIYANANELRNERREVASRHCCQAVKTSLET